MFESYSERKKYPISLKIDCQNLDEEQMSDLTDKLRIFQPVKWIGGDTIFFNGNVTQIVYEKIWAILDYYDVIID